MPFAASISQHPLASHAVGEVVGAVLDEIGPAPDLAVAFLSTPHVGATDEIVGAIRALLGPRVLLAVTAESITGGALEVERAAAVSIWAGSVGEMARARLSVRAGPEGPDLVGMPQAHDDAGTLVLLADPFSFPVDVALDALGRSHPGLQVIGGLASAARGPGGNRLVLDDGVHHDGAVGVLLPATTPVTTVVSQGCRPIGDPLTVTAADRNMLVELAGRPALERLQSIVEALTPQDRALATQGLHLGLVVNEHQLEFRRGDFLIRNVIGADPETGAVAVGEIVPVGATVQFQVRDAASADEDLRELLSGHDPDGALLFTCNGRGSNLFGQPGHDAGLVAEITTPAATAGMFCAGELGPIAGRNFLHGFTASIALFDA